MKTSKYINTPKKKKKSDSSVATVFSAFTFPWQDKTQRLAKSRTEKRTASLSKKDKKSSKS